MYSSRVPPCSTIRRLGGCLRPGPGDNGTLAGGAPALPMRHPVAQFALAGLAVLAVFGAAALLALRGLGNAADLRDRRQVATMAGQGIVEPTVAPGLLRGEPEAIAAVDRIVQERVLGERVGRVQLLGAGRRVRELA